MLKAKEILDIKLYPRYLLERASKIIDEKEAILVKGARRVGKTSLLYLIGQYILSSKKGNVYYFDLEDPDDLDIVSGGPRALKKIFGDGYYLVDEIHLMNRPDRFIKLIVDHYPEIKLICSDSSNIALNRKFKDSLIGRIIELEMFPLSFREYLIFMEKTEYLSVLPQINIFSPSIKGVELIPEFLYRDYEEYLRIGGYPEVILAGKEENRSRILSKMFRIYAKRDLQYLFQLRKEIAFEKFFYAVAATAGNLFNLSEIASEIGVSIKTDKEYLTILETLFLVKVLHPFTPNIRTEIKKMPKVYFVDTGLLNWAIGSLASLENRPDAGRIAENGVFISLLRKSSDSTKINFWRRRSGGEVDFVVREKSIMPLEAKWQRRFSIPQGLRNFMKTYRVNTGIITVRGKSKIKKFGNYRFFFIPAMIL